MGGTLAKVTLSNCSMMHMLTGSKLTFGSVPRISAAIWEAAASPWRKARNACFTLGNACFTLGIHRPTPQSPATGFPRRPAE
jgi:hypothetical protein